MAQRTSPGSGGTRRLQAVLLLVLGVFALLYWRSLFLSPYADDWLLVSPVRALVARYGYWAALPQLLLTTFSGFWRPLALLPYLIAPHHLAVVQCLKLLAVLGLAGMTARVARTFLSREWTLVVVAVLLLHQMNAATYSELDEWGDILSALGLMGVLWSSVRYERGRHGLARYLTGTALYTALAVLTKEAGLVAFLTPLVMLLLRGRAFADTAPRRGHLFAAGVSLGVVMLYLLARHALGLEFMGSAAAAGSYYSLHFGRNLVTNPLLMLVALFSPVNTVQVALGAPVWKALAGVWTVIVGAACLLGFYRHVRGARWQTPLALLLLFFISQGPVLLMGHPTEANLLRSLGPGLIAVGISLAAVPWPRRGVGLVLVLALATGWAGFNLTASFDKVGRIAGRHAQIERFRREVMAAIPEPCGHRLLFVAETPLERGYSAFVQPLAATLMLELPHGFRDAYRDSLLQTPYVQVASLAVLPDSLSVPDVAIDRHGVVTFPATRL